MIYVGSCSWAEKSLVAGGRFYPSGIETAAERLHYYASVFPTVEVDSSYYALPSRRNAEAWARRTPDGFLFHVKAYGAMTGHPVERRALPADLRDRVAGEAGTGKVRLRDLGLVRELAARFDSSMEPLHEAGKLGCVLFQFPPTLKGGSRTLDFLSRALSLSRFPKAVEFRHGSWYAPGIREDVLALLSELEAVLVCADEPDFGDHSTVPFQFIPTGRDAYFRLHGRNKETWFAKGIDAARRFDYSYSVEELEGMVPSFLEADASLNRVFVLFNNHKDGQGMANARQLIGMLSERGARLAQ